MAREQVLVVRTDAERRHEREGQQVAANSALRDEGTSVLYAELSGRGSSATNTHTRARARALTGENLSRTATKFEPSANAAKLLCAIIARYLPHI